MIAKRGFLYGGKVIEPNATFEAHKEDAGWLSGGPQPYAADNSRQASTKTSTRKKSSK